MKRLASFVLLFLCCTKLIAQLAPLERIEPMSWWAGMKNPQLQLIVHGSRIAEWNVRLNYPGVKLVKVHKVENANYLFIDLIISPSAKPGVFNISFTKSGFKELTFLYQLKAKDKSPKRIDGVNSSDLIYLIMPDRFSNGDKSNDVVKSMREDMLNRDSIYTRHGGDLQGIINHLNYLKNLGVTTIWCTPEVENDMPKASYHGYAVTDHYKIDPRFGSNELYKTFADECQKIGLKVIKDLVHNHTGTEHWFIKDLPMTSWVHQWNNYTQTNYRDHTLMDPYGSVKDRKRMLDGWFVSTMPDLNHRNPFVRNYLTQNHIWWIEYAGIDGLRLDTYAYNDPAYMADWAEKIRSEFPTLSIFGETLVDGIVNQAFFTEGRTLNQPLNTHLPGITDVQLKDAIYEALNTNSSNRLYGVLSNDFIYQDPFKNVIFMDNHDMSRFYSKVGEDLRKYKSGLALLLTTRGIPQIYYGTEILMKNFSNPDGLVRSDFPGGWEKDKVNKFSAKGRNESENDAYDYLMKLANYRKKSAALSEGKLMQFAPEDGVYVYFRYSANQTVMVISNSNQKEINVTTARFTERLANLKKAKNIITQEVIQDISQINIPPQTTLVLELQ
jgi:glycosidase